MAKANKKKTVRKDDPTKGIAPLVAEKPTVEINGEKYELRRLGVMDTFTFARLIASGAQADGLSLSDLGDDLNLLHNCLLAGLIRNQFEAVKLLASLIDVEAKEFIDPEQFPMDAPFTIAKALVEHEDLAAFFTSLGPALKMLQPETPKS